MVECHQGTCIAARETTISYGSVALESGITPAGYAIYFYTYSTFEGKSVYLEDVYIRSEHRSELTSA